MFKKNFRVDEIYLVQSITIGNNIVKSVENLARDVGVLAACDALCLPRATYYRHMQPALPERPPRKQVPSPLALILEERQGVSDVLHPIGLSTRPLIRPMQPCYEGVYHCSIGTMYRILRAEHGDVKERRNQVNRPVYAKPELLATAPDTVWSWDITKLKGPVKWRYFHLYVIMDIFSRYVVGWMVAHREGIGHTVYP